MVIFLLALSNFQYEGFDCLFLTWFYSGHGYLIKLRTNSERVIPFLRASFFKRACSLRGRWTKMRLVFMVGIRVTYPVYPPS